MTSDTTRNDYGFPVVSRLAQAQAMAADARSRNFPLPCECRECKAVQNLPAVQRILAKWVPMDRGV